jgi:RNA polymerase subunit RPABC4/transcription elongation factor Spt4
MGVATKSGMFCYQNCRQPVAAIKSTHRLRNSVVGVTAIGTGGLSLAAAKAGDWHCPSCGGPVMTVKEWNRQVAKAQAEQAHAAAIASPIHLSAASVHERRTVQCGNCKRYWGQPAELCRSCNAQLPT